MIDINLIVNSDPQHLTEFIHFLDFSFLGSLD